MTAPDFGPCPHCRSAEIVWIPSGPTDGYNRSGVQISAFRGISFDRLICLQCGLVREWVADPKKLALLRKRYGRK